MAVSKSNWVAVSYTGTLTDGTVFDKSQEPLQFEVGAGMVIKGFDAAVEGMEVGAEKEFLIPCAEAYGTMSDDRKETVPKEFFKEITPEIGAVLMAQTPMGPLKLKVLTIADTGVTVSLNHPLAGEDLGFKIKVEKILTEAEIAKAKENHEHSHSEGCECGKKECADDCDCKKEEQ